MAVAGPGTGFGSGYLVWNGQHYEALPSEGGHVIFYNHKQKELMDFLLESVQKQEKQYTQLSAEIVLSGNYFHKYYEFYKTQYDTDPDF